MSRVHVPEVVEPDDQLPLDLIALRRFARIMDDVIRVPGTQLAFGLDAGLNLFPGIGTVAGAILSTWIVLGGIRHRVPVLRIVQMLINILIDLAVGWIPFAGEGFKLLFRESTLNYRILMRHRDRVSLPRSPAQMAGGAALVIFIVLSACLILLCGIIVGTIWLVQRQW